MISKRTKISLCQFLKLFDIEDVILILEKYDIDSDILKHHIYHSTTGYTTKLHNLIIECDSANIINILMEIVKTQSDIKNKTNTTAYAFHERRDDLYNNLELDGYTIKNSTLVTVDTLSTENKAFEDALTDELEASTLDKKKELIRKIKQSAQNYLNNPPDYNACLSNARIALSTIAEEIAIERNKTIDGSFDKSKWGQVIRFLNKSGFINKKEEEGLTGVYSFISDGAHRIVGFQDNEMASLGRNFAINMCYFLVKRYNAE